MTKKKLTNTAQDVNESRLAGIEQGNRSGYKQGLKIGVEIAKLEAFAVCADGKPFWVHPSCYRYVLPLVTERLKALGVDLDGKRAEGLIRSFVEPLREPWGMAE